MFILLLARLDIDLALVLSEKVISTRPKIESSQYMG